MRGARAEATAICTANGPALSGSSVVPVVTIGGRTLDVTQLEQIVERLPTGALVRIKFNEQTRSGTTLVQRAVHLEVQDPAGRIVKDVVVAEAKVSGGSQVCDRAAQEDTANGGDGNGSGGNGDVGPCIRGAEYDAARNLCIITRERDGNLANGRELVTVVGKPFEGPSGGRVALPAEAPKSAQKSTCLKGKGVKFLVLGTKKADRITGSNRADVIFSFGGNDKISGGRGNDCIVGGKGADRLAARSGKDTLVGGKGGDNLNGGSEADKLMGGVRQGLDQRRLRPRQGQLRQGQRRDQRRDRRSRRARALRQGQGRRPLQHQRAPAREGLRAPLLDPLTSSNRADPDAPESPNGSGAPRVLSA